MFILRGGCVYVYVSKFVEVGNVRIIFSNVECIEYKGVE